LVLVIGNLFTEDVLLPVLWVAILVGQLDPYHAKCGQCARGETTLICDQLLDHFVGEQHVLFIDLLVKAQPTVHAISNGVNGWPSLDALVDETGMGETKSYSPTGFRIDGEQIWVDTSPELATDFGHELNELFQKYEITNFFTPKHTPDSLK
jgi:hypothetical protein